jgi:hypothetical protein
MEHTSEVKNRFNRYMHKSNNGADFGRIDIYYTPIVEPSLNYDKVVWIDRSKRAVIKSNCTGRVTNFTISPALPIGMYLDNTTGDINISKVDTKNLPEFFTVQAEGLNKLLTQQFKVINVHTFTTEDRIVLSPSQSISKTISEIDPDNLKFTSKPPLPSGASIDDTGSVVYAPFDSIGTPNILEWFDLTTYSISAWDNSLQAKTPLINWKVSVIVKQVMPAEISYPSLDGVILPIGREIRSYGTIVMAHTVGKAYAFPTSEPFKDKKGLSFKITPDLPKGIRICEYSGDIHGTTHEITDFTEYTIVVTNSYSTKNVFVTFGTDSSRSPRSPKKISA